MKIFKIIKNIYTHPSQAFDAESLESTFWEAVIIFLVLGSLQLTVSLRLIPLAHLSTHARIWIFMVMLCVGAIGWTFVYWLIRKGVRRKGSNLTFKGFVSGNIWITVAMWPGNVGLLLLSLRYPQAHMVINILMILLTGAAFYLVVCCIHGLSGLPGRTCLKITVLAYAPFLVLVVALIIFSAVIAFYVIVKHPEIIHRRSAAGFQSLNCSYFITDSMLQTAFGNPRLLSRQGPSAFPDQMKSCIYSRQPDSADIMIDLNPLTDPNAGPRRMYYASKQYCPNSQQSDTKIGIDTYMCSQRNPTGIVTWLGFIDSSGQYYVEMISSLWVSPEQLKTLASELNASITAQKTHF